MKRFLVALPLALVACSAGADKPATITPRDSGSAFQADEIVLRVEFRGGFVMPGTDLSSVPSFALFGDGRIVRPGPQIEIYPSPALPAIQVSKVSVETVKRIAEEARAAGIDGQERDYGEPPVADAPDTIFTLRDGDRLLVTRVSSLGFEADGPNMTAEQKAARRKISELVEHLGGINDWLGAGTESDGQAFTFSELAVVARTYVNPDEGLTQQPKVWRGPDPGGTAADEREIRCVTVEGADLDRVRPDVEQTNSATPWVAGTARWSFTFRPLLPDEHTCADLAR